jgi:hypothetical protein
MSDPDASSVLMDVELERRMIEIRRLVGITLPMAVTC